jgi:glycosyltransferase involved in cell wall biosynthesis
MAVYNGVALLPRKIQHLLELDYSNIKEIVIVSDGSTDGTAELLARQEQFSLKTIILKEQGGKAAAVNAGVAEATGDVILFVDIRPEIAPGAIQQLVANFADPKVGCVAGELILRQEGHDATSEAVGGLYWRYEQWIRKCEADFDSPVGVYGGFYAMICFSRFRSSARAIGRFWIPEPAYSTHGRRRLKANFIARCGRWRGTFNSSRLRPGR